MKLVLAILVCGAAELFAGPVFSWSFDQPFGVASQNDPIPLFATLENLGTTTIIGGASAGMNTGAFFPSYSFSFGDFFAQFDAPIAPGATFSL